MSHYSNYLLNFNSYLAVYCTLNVEFCLQISNYYATGAVVEMSDDNYLLLFTYILNCY